MKKDLILVPNPQLDITSSSFCGFIEYDMNVVVNLTMFIFVETSYEQNV